MKPPVERSRVLEASVSRRVPPENLIEQDAELFSHEYTHIHPEVFRWTGEMLKVLPGGLILSRGNFLPLREALAADTAIHWKQVLRSMEGRLRAPVGRELENAWFITDQFSNGYFHWMLDVLPKLELLDEVPENLVIPAMADYSYVRPSLEPYGIKNTVIGQPGESIFVRRMEGMTALAVSGNYREMLLEKLRTRFRAWASPGPAVRKIYISRSRARWRKLAGEEHLLPVFRDAGFEILHFEDMDFKEQVKTAAESQILISNHGAGLTNMVFMPAGGRVLEIRRRGDRENNCYFSLARAMGLEYWYLLGEGLSADTHTSDLQIDRPQLESAIDKLLKREKVKDQSGR